MSSERFLAFDLGAESGRAVVGTLAGETLALEEIHRFANEAVEVRGTLYWDVLSLYNNLQKGMRAYAQKFGPEVDAIGIDTWGVDFGLLARDGALQFVPESITPQGLVASLIPTMANQALGQYTSQWYVEKVQILDGRMEIRIR